MAIKSASISCFLRCGSAAGAIRPSVWARSAAFLGRDSRTDGASSKLSCSAPTPWSYANNFDSDSESMPPGPWWGEALLEQDSEFFPLADFIPVGQGRKELDAIWHALVAGPLESIILTLREIMAAGNLFRCRSFHVGTLSGALLVVAAFCQLCKTTPALFMDIVLGALNIYMYFIMAYDVTVGVKHGRLYWLAIYRWLRTKGGLMKVLKHTFLDIFGGNKKPVSIKRRNRKRQ